MIGAGRNGLLFLFALALGCGTISWLLPLPEIGEVTAKLEYLRQHPALYDTLFFGSSRINHQIIPSEFDAEMAAAGRPARTFNAGIDGMQPPELNFFIEQVLSCHLTGVRRVFVETGTLSSEILPDRRDTMRGTYWHDWRRMSQVVRAAWQEHLQRRRKKWPEYLDSLAVAAHNIREQSLPFIRHCLNLGRVSLFTDSLQGEVPPVSQYSLGKRSDGFTVADRTEMNAAERAQYEASLARRQAYATEIYLGTPVAQQAFATMLKELEGLGASTVLLTTPTTSLHKFHVLPEVERQHLLLDYSDPHKYAELYEPDHRLDTDHINQQGSEIFTRLVAKEYCAALAAHP